MNLCLSPASKLNGFIKALLTHGFLDLLSLGTRRHIMPHYGTCINTVDVHNTHHVYIYIYNINQFNS